MSVSIKGSIAGGLYVASAFKQASPRRVVRVDPEPVRELTPDTITAAWGNSSSGVD